MYYIVIPTSCGHFLWFKVLSTPGKKATGLQRSQKDVPCSAHLFHRHPPSGSRCQVKYWIVILTSCGEFHRCEVLVTPGKNVTGLHASQQDVPRLGHWSHKHPPSGFGCQLKYWMVIPTFCGQFYMCKMLLTPGKNVTGLHASQQDVPRLGR